MKRYDVQCASDLWEHPEGDYMLHADHLDFVQRVKAEAEKMEHIGECDAEWEWHEDSFDGAKRILREQPDDSICNCQRGRIIAMCEEEM